ncbi:MAG TPA: SMC-Scp complex subunit ScpB [Clostridiales bacterium]|nr:SMC-Scp complex subunit ScpB [Clostridiales bacterium]
MIDESTSLQQENLGDFLESSDQEFHLSPDEAPAALEALLFAAGDPLPFDKLRQITGLERTLLEQILRTMADRYMRDRQRGILLREVEGSWMFSTKPGLSDVLQRLFQPRHRPPLSQAAYETLAIIAYNQPVTRAQVEAVRGVNSDSIISRLIERNLIREAGTLEAPGRPTLFATTEQFLLDFGLRSVKDLPPMEMLMYGTLRDFEQSLETAAGHPRDNQITIEQIVSTLLPEAQPAVTAQGNDPEPASLPDNQVLDLSVALFGENSDDS